MNFKTLTTAIFACSLIIIIPACKKTGSDAHTPPNTPLKSAMQISLSDTTIHTYTYDSQNRVIEDDITYRTPFSVSSDTITYIFTGDSVIQHQTLVGADSIVYYLNSQGYAATSSTYSSWVYNTDGYLTSTTFSGGNKVYTYNSNNQIATITTNDIYGTVVDTYTYPADAGPITNNWNFGKSNGIYWATEMYNRTQGSSTSSGTTNATYLYDSQYRIIQKNITGTAGINPSVTYYTY